MRTPRLFLCDPNLRTQHGHYLGYASLVADAAAALGVEPFVLASLHASPPAGTVCPILPAFSQTYWEELRDPSGADPHLHLTRSADRFGAELLRALRPLDGNAGDVLFLPYANLVEVLGLARSLRSPGTQTTPRVVLLFRRPVHEQANDASLTRHAHAALLRHAVAELHQIAGSRLRLLTDSDELTEEHTEVTGRPFQTAPIPVDPRFGREPLHTPAPPLTIGYFGDARREKGYQYLPELAEALRVDLATGRVQLVVQSNFNVPGGEPGMAEAFDRLRQFPNVVLLLDPPDADEYARLMRATHLIVLPYEADRYRVRTSGILAEAVHAAVPAIVPRATWLAEQIRLSGAGVIYSPVEPQGFIRAVRHALEHLADLRTRARDRREAFVQFHNPERLARFVLGVEVIAQAVRARRSTALVAASRPASRVARQVVVPHTQWTLTCERDAAPSTDSRVPHGTRRDNSANALFAQRLERLRGREHLSLLDLGCSGGGFVRMCVERGHDAIGLEGSPYSRHTARAEWPAIPDRLFTCDITAPFQLRRAASGEPAAPGQFDVITAWEVIEHVAAEDVAVLCANVARHLARGGLWIMSVSAAADPSRARPGVDWHRCVQPRDWWLGTLQANGFTNHPELVDYFGQDWVRGPLQNAPSSFHLVLAATGTVVPQPVSFEFDVPTLLTAGVDFLTLGTSSPGFLPYALNLFDRALAVADDLTEVQFLRAATLLRLGRLDDATAAAGSCLAMRPGHAGAQAIRDALDLPRLLDHRPSAAKAG